MKIPSCTWFCILLSGSLAASGQTPLKLALSGVEVTPTLAKKYSSPSPATDASAPTAAQPVNALGVWTGTLQNPQSAMPVSLIITRSPDGSIYAEFHNEATPAQFRTTSIAGSALDGTGNHLKLGFINSNARKPVPFVLMGDLDAGSKTMSAQWIAGGGRSVTPVTLFRSSGGSSPGAGAPMSAATLEDLAHTINVQLFDHFNGEQLFSIVGDADLKQAIPPASNGSPAAYDLKNPATVDKFKAAGINYLLVTSLEDYQDQTLEVRRAQNLHYQTQVYNQARRRGNFASAGVQTQGGIDPEVWQRQIVTLKMRGQLFDATTGELKKSASSSFPSQRDFVAVAQGKNELSTADLLAVAAQKVSEWAAVLVDDTLFPIQVLAKNDNVITISRGMEAGLKVGQVFNVYVSGDEIKDPNTGRVLGRDLKRVGRVSITELQPKFSKATISEDTGIVNGATLARSNVN